MNSGLKLCQEKGTHGIILQLDSLPLEQMLKINYYQNLKLCLTFNKR